MEVLERLRRKPVELQKERGARQAEPMPIGGPRKLEGE
jgi:hypothetical protein